MLWQIEIVPAAGKPDLEAQRIAADAADLGIAPQLALQTARGYLLEGPIDREQAELLASQLLADRVVEQTVVAPVGDESLAVPVAADWRLVHVLPKPGVMDPVAMSAQQAIHDYEVPVAEVRTFQEILDWPACRSPIAAALQ